MDNEKLKRPDWMPETHLKRRELIDLMVCICYHLILRCSDPKAAPEDKAILPGLVTAMAELLNQ